MSNFRPGDKVVCIENKGRPDLKFLQEYIVEWHRGSMIKVEGPDLAAFDRRFELSKKHYLNEFERLL